MIDLQKLQKKIDDLLDSPNFVEEFDEWLDNKRKNMKNEEPKESLKKICKCKRAYENPLSEICSLCWNELFPNEKEEVKKEDLLESKQRTIEEAAENFVNNTRLKNYKVLFIEGAKSEAARNYWFEIFTKLS